MFPLVAEKMDAFVKKGEIAGAVTLVWHKGKIVHQHVTGLADIASKRAMKFDDVFWIASVTKPMTAVAIMMLVEAGKLSIDDPLEKFLPVFTKPWRVEEESEERKVLVRAKNLVTIKDLLMHTDGLADSQVPVEGTPLAEWVASSTRLPLLFEPGSKWAYNNMGMNALGRIVEIVSGEPFADFLQKHLFEPMEMKETTFYPSKEQAARLATSYKLEPDTRVLTATQTPMLNGPVTSKLRTVCPGGGLFSTAADVLAFNQMMLARGVYRGKQIICEQSAIDLTRTQTGDLKTGFTEGMSFGLGFAVVKEPQGVTAMLSQGTFGHGGAYGNSSWADPKHNLVMIMMIQRSNLVPNGDGCDIRFEFQEAAAKSLEKA